MEIIRSLPEILSVIMALIGLVITVVGLPGVWLVYIGMFTWSWSNGFSEISWVWLLIFFLITLASTLVDNIAVLFGAKKYGASVWGMVGSIAGLIVGALIANIPGLIIGAFLGAVGLEMIFAKKDSHQAMKAGLGALLGFVLSNLIKFFIALSMLLAWWLIAR